MIHSKLRKVLTLGTFPKMIHLWQMKTAHGHKYYACGKSQLQPPIVAAIVAVAADVIAVDDADVACVGDVDDADVVVDVDDAFYCGCFYYRWMSG